MALSPSKGEPCFTVKKNCEHSASAAISGLSFTPVWCLLFSLYLQQKFSKCSCQGNVLEMRILRPRGTETLGWDPAVCVLTCPLAGFFALIFFYSLSFFSPPSLTFHLPSPSSSKSILSWKASCSPRASSLEKCRESSPSDPP